jgi:hypothetical protein
MSDAPKSPPFSASPNNLSDWLLRNCAPAAPVHINRSVYPISKSKSIQSEIYSIISRLTRASVKLPQRKLPLGEPDLEGEPGKPQHPPHHGNIWVQSKLHAGGDPRGTRLMRDSGHSKPGRFYRPAGSPLDNATFGGWPLASYASGYRTRPVSMQKHQSTTQVSQFLREAVRWTKQRSCGLVGRKCSNDGTTVPACCAAFYLRELLIALNLVLSLPPIPFTTAMIASAMPAAIRPYSIAVAPESSATNLRMAFIIRPD